MRHARRLIVATALLATTPTIVVGSNASLMQAVSSGLDRALSAEASAKAGSPTSVQAAYDAARDFQEAVMRSAPVSSSCRPLMRDSTAMASALVAEQEGFDRPSGAERASAARRVIALRGRLGADGARCSGTGSASADRVVAMRPTTAEAFFGAIVSRGPASARRAVVSVGVRPWRKLQLKDRVLRVDVTGSAPGRYSFGITFLDESDKTVGVATARDTWLLPESAQIATPASREDSSLTSTFGRIAQNASGTVSIWAQDLRTGRYAGVNAGAKFPAASTVKLGVLAGAIHRIGQTVDTSPMFYDLQAIGGWSSNLAANRIVERLGAGCGGSNDALANDGLRMLGAKDSTYTGCYIVGTELQPDLPDAPAVNSPPLQTQRVTTAQDLARMMFSLQAAAIGAPRARAETGLSTKQARQILGLLLSSQQVGDNRSLVVAGAPKGTPIAQKNGWLRSARLSASIAYLASGPIIVTLATQSSSGVSLPTAQTLGRQAMSAAVKAFQIAG